jgi:Alpha-kinase family
MGKWKVNFENAPFAKGQLRDAYMGTVAEGTVVGRTSGQKVVVKLMRRDQYELGRRITVADELMHERVRQFANEFAGQLPGAPSVSVLQASRGVVTRLGGNSTLELGEGTFVEPFLHGKFEKYTSNSGYSITAASSAFHSL